MQLLLAERLHAPRALTATLVSAGVHASVVVLLVLSGRQVVNRVRDLIEETVQYLYPVPRDIGPLRPGLASESTVSRPRAIGSLTPRVADHAGGAGRSAGAVRAGVSFTQDPSGAETMEPGIGDNAYSVVEVDAEAAVDPASAAPEYPQAMALRGVEGSAVFRFVVDSTGFIDMATVQVTSATHKLFAQAVLDAMPKMRYRPASIGDRAVRLLVQQAFWFKIQQPRRKIA